MRKFFSLLIVAVMAMTMSTALADETCLTLNFNDGRVIKFGFSDKPAMTFLNDDMVITTDEQEVSYPRTDLLNFTFTQGTTTGVKGVDAEGCFVNFTSRNSFTVAGVDSGLIRVYSINGNCLLSVAAAGNTTVSLAGLQSGVYVVEIPGMKPLKIRK